jgi:hypothetical protein
MGPEKVRHHGSHYPLSRHKGPKEKERPAWSTIQKDVVVFVEDGSQGGHKSPLRAHFSGQHLKSSGYSGMGWEKINATRSGDNGLFGGNMTKQNMADMGTRGKATLEEYPGSRRLGIKVYKKSFPLLG